jgi:hypothetical protein
MREERGRGGGRSKLLPPHPRASRSMPEKDRDQHMQEGRMRMALTRGIYETTFLAALDAGKSIEYTDRDGANFFRVFRGHHHRRSNTKKIAPSRSVYPRLS